MPTRSVRNERGVALLVALVALVVIGAIVAGSFFVSSIEARTGRNSVEAAQALRAAEAGLETTIGNWPVSYNTLAMGDSIVLAPQSFAGSTYAVRVFALNGSLFLIESTGSRGGATQRLGLTVRRDIKDVKVKAAISVNSPVTFNGNAFAVTGVNANPLRLLDCPVVPAPVSVVAVRSSTGTGMGLLDADNVLGQTSLLPVGPGSAVGNDTSVTNLTNSIFSPGGVYDQLRATATVTLTPGTYTSIQPRLTPSGQCDRAHPQNWGEPWLSGVLACGDHYPVVLGAGAGELKVSSSGRGQGVLLVDGDLEMTGGFEFNGLVLVKGQFKISGTGTRVLGAVVAQNGGTVENNAMSGNTVIGYSSCSVANALKNSAKVVPLAGRPWSQLF